MSNKHCNKCKTQSLQPIRTNCNDHNNITESDTFSISSSSDSSSCNINDQLTNIIDNIDQQISNSNDFIQNQVNLLNTSYIEIINELKVENNRYQVVINEINNINDTLDEFKQDVIDCCKPSSCTHESCCGKIVYTDVTKIHIFVVEIDIKFLFISGLGGGGMSGQNCIKNMYYIHGGGGGASSAIIKRVVPVTIGTIIKITIGKGGNVNFEPNGGDTIIEITRPDKTTEIIVIKGGKHGNPLDCNINVSGGKGGESEQCILNGCDGEDGSISLPSYICSTPSMGGNSLFYKPSRGGTSLLFPGGSFGEAKYGCGGSAMTPKYTLNNSQKLSGNEGNGGNGLVIIEW